MWKLDIPGSNQLHPVFNEQLLTPYVEPPTPEGEAAGTADRNRLQRIRSRCDIEPSEEGKRLPIFSKVEGLSSWREDVGTQSSLDEREKDPQ